MLDYSKTRELRTKERDIAAGATITAEGSALVADLTSGVIAVKPSTGAAGEKFLGVSKSQVITALTLPGIFEGIADNVTAVLPNTSISGSLLVIDTTTGTTLAAGNPGTTANQYSIAGDNKTLTFHTGQEDHGIRVYYRYNPTVLQARAAQGDQLPGGPASFQYGRIGCIESADVYTSEYDTATNWATVTAVKLGAGGVFTGAGSGVTLANAIVLQVPTAADPFLGLRIGVAV